MLNTEPVDEKLERDRDADKSLARPTSRYRRTELIVSLEANLLLISNNMRLLQTVINLYRDERQLIFLIFTEGL